MKFLKLFFPTTLFGIIWHLILSLLNTLVYTGNLFDDPGHWYNGVIALVLLFTGVAGVGYQVGKGITGSN